MIIDVKPEFGYEIACSIPYAYWLHKRGELEKVITCKGMKPFYYFCDNVEEKYEQRSVNNSTNGVQNLPNCWIHHNTHVFFKDKTSKKTTKNRQNVVLKHTCFFYIKICAFFFGFLRSGVDFGRPRGLQKLQKID